MDEYHNVLYNSEIQSKIDLLKSNRSSFKEYKKNRTAVQNLKKSTNDGVKKQHKSPGDKKSEKSNSKLKEIAKDGGISNEGKPNKKKNSTTDKLAVVYNTSKKVKEDMITFTNDNSLHTNDVNTPKDTGGKRKKLNDQADRDRAQVRGHSDPSTISTLVSDHKKLKSDSTSTSLRSDKEDDKIVVEDIQFGAIIAGGSSQKGSKLGEAPRPGEGHCNRVLRSAILS